MRKLISTLMALVIFSTMLCGLTVISTAADTYDQQPPLRLYYDEEAPFGGEGLEKAPQYGTALNDGWERWSVPIGNGYMGVNVFGRTQTERLQITENSLSTPYASDGGGLTNFAEVYMDFGHTHSKVTGYSRDLSLDEGTAHVDYTYNGVKYSREIFSSYPDKVTVVKLDADKAGKVSFTLRAEIPFLEEYNTVGGILRGKSGTVASAGDTITLSGDFGAYKIKYEGQIKVIPEGGTLTASNGNLTLTGADSAVIIIAVGTNYKLGDSEIFMANTDAERAAVIAKNPAPHDKVTEYLNAAAKKDYATLLANHKADYKELFDRVKLNLGTDTAAYNKTTDVLLDEYKAGKFSPYLEALYFQYGRYLLICSSRKGTLPPHLQGIWNRYKNPPWSSGYWHNINIQMNYWPVFSTNLAELFDCYIDFYKTFLPRSEKDAEDHFAAKHPNNVGLSERSGWSVGTAVWPFRMTHSFGNASGGYGESALMAKSFAEYYNFTMDKELLENELYSAVSGAAIFTTKAMEPYGDVLLATPSGSPEQVHNGGNVSTIGSAWDQMNAYEAHKDTIKLAEVLGKSDDADVKMLKSRIDKLDPVIVGASGQIKEFREENYYGDIGQYTHRHISHLVGLYPGTIINDTTPAWMDAAMYSLTERGDQSTGWAMAHRFNLWTRTKRGDRAYDLYRQLLQTGTNNNLWDVHPPFQIDGNLGGTAAVAEMLLQSHEGYIEPLPAVPHEWSDGSYSGLVARGNFEVSAKWQSNQMKSIKITSNAGEPCRLKYFNVGSAVVTASDSTSVSVNRESTDLISFETKKGVSYTISSIPRYTEVAAPSNLQAAASEERLDKINLSWTASEDAASYSVYCAMESAPDYTLIAEGVTDTAYTHFTAPEDASKQRTYKVTAVGANERESKWGATDVVEAVTVAVPEDIKGAFVKENTLQVTCADVEDADEYVLYIKNGEEWEEAVRSSYPLVIFENADEAATYGFAASMKKILSEITEISIERETAVDNVFLGQNITSEATVIAKLYLENALDGDMSTRYAVSDANPNYSVTIELDRAYTLDTLKIYEFRDGAGTRSEETTIELFYNDQWTTVIDKQSLKPDTQNGECTEFSMGNKPATKVRITYNNTEGTLNAATIWEIQCSGTRIARNVMDMSDLYYSLLLASTIDTSKMSSTELTKWNNTVSAAEACINSISATQSTVDTCADQLISLGLSHGGVMPAAPVISKVEIAGSPEKYNTLTVDYTFSDANGNKDVCSKIFWQVSDDGEQWQDISGATEKNYTIPKEYAGKYLRAIVKPGADAEPVYGKAVASEKVGPVSDLTASLDIKADITDDNGVALTAPIAKNTPVNINVSCKNIGDKTLFSINLIVAMYDKDNRLVEVLSKPASNVAVGEAVSINDLKWTTPDSSGATIKIFAWNSITGLHPYNNCVVLP